MVAGRAGYHTAFLFLVGQLGNLVVRPAHLERACNLQILRLQVDRAIGIDFGRMNQIGAPDYVAKDIRGIVNFFECKHRLCRLELFISSSEFCKHWPHPANAR